MTVEKDAICDRADAVVIGAGHNGLATAIMLAEAGWSVVVLEQASEPGGAVKTAEVTLPGFRHDLMAMNLNLFAGSPFFARYGERLTKHGLAMSPSTRPVCSLFPGDRYVGVSTDLDETVASIAAFDETDGQAFQQLRADFDRQAPHMFALLGAPLPSARAARLVANGARHLGKSWPLDTVRLATQSTRAFTTEHFRSPEVQALVAAWGMHLDFGPDIPGGALFAYLETMACQANGMVVGTGGARTIIDAMTALLRELGGTVICGAPVDRVITERGRAIAVDVGGHRVSAHRAIVANVTPGRLYDHLLDATAVPDDVTRRVRGFRHGPGAFMVHLALSGPPQWTRPEANEHAYVHIGPYLDDMARTYQQAAAGLVPDRPTLVVGQPTVVDPTRAPEGRHTLWIQARMFPGDFTGDAAGTLSGRTWDEVADPVAERIVDQLEEYAPGLRSSILGRHVLTPADLERANPNLVGGDSLGGSHHISQNFFLRPFPGASRYRTPIDRLYLCGASTWPGAGLGAGSGYLLGEMLTRRRVVRRR